MFKKILLISSLALMALPLVSVAAAADPAGFIVQAANLPAPDSSPRMAAAVPNEFTTSLSLVSDASGPVSVGDTVDISVIADPGGHSINTISAILQYPAGLLDPTATNYDGSAYSLFLENSGVPLPANEVSVIAMQPYPGISQSSVVATFVFKAKQPGTATFSIASGTEVYADDGLGTETGIDAQPLSITIL